MGKPFTRSEYNDLMSALKAAREYYYNKADAPGVVALKLSGAWERRASKTTKVIEKVDSLREELSE